MSVVEPTICHYELRFETPLVCPIDALLGKIFIASNMSRNSVVKHVAMTRNVKLL